jgi:orotate phosphoribosyltransferase
MTGSLADRMIEVSELHGDFDLSSGARSSVYFDKFRFLCDPGLLGEVASAVAEQLPENVTHLAAPEGAATLLLAAVGLRTRLPTSMVRKQPKEYGTRARVEGYAPAGARVALLEDVVTTGGQVLQAATALEEHGARVVAILVALDRGGADTIRDAGYECRAVVSLRPGT